jgi:phospholipase A2
MIFKKQFFLFLVLISSINYADTITVHNNTCRDLFIAVYKQPMHVPFFQKSEAIKYDAINKVKAKESIEVDRSAWQFGYFRYLTFTEDDSQLADILTSEQLEKLHAKDICSIQGTVFYIGDSEGDFFAYNYAEWNLVHIPLETAEQALLSMIPALHNNPYKEKVAYVRYGNELCNAEQQFRAIRRNKVKEKMQLLLNREIDTVKVPTIAILSSGGGYRALLYTMGALCAAADSGILDCSTYLLGLSGSTWAIGSWISSGRSPRVYHNWLIDNLCLAINDFDQSDLTLAGQIILTKYFSGQPIGFIECYGAFLANDLFEMFSVERDRVYLSDQKKYTDFGSLPLPIYTAISAETTATENCWYEFTPYEVGASWLGIYTPTWAFGRKFKNGGSITYDPEQSLCTLMATFGLAVGVTIAEMLKETNIEQKISLPLLKNLLNKIIANFGDNRPISAQFHNFTKGIAQSPYAALSDIQLVDAGLNFNIPYPPVSGQRPDRLMDIIIILDSSAGAVGSELKSAEAFARQRGLKFPYIDYSVIQQHAVSLFFDPNDSQAPAVIYIPRVVDEALLSVHKDDPAFKDFYPLLHGFDIEKCIEKEACNTFNFFYSKQEARQLTALGEFNFKCAQEAILLAINAKMNQK